MLIQVDHLLQTGRTIAINQIIGQNHSKGFITDDRTGTLHRMPQPQGLRLADIHTGHPFRHNIPHQIQQVLLFPQTQLRLQFIILIEMILNSPLTAAGDKDQLGNTRRNGLLGRILNQRLVHNRHHFFRSGLGGREKPRTETGDRKNRLLDQLCHIMCGLLDSCY